MQNTKIKTFLYYFDKNNLIFKIDPFLKISLYLLLNILVLINKNYILNIAFSLILIVILCLLGVFKYHKKFLPLLFLSLLFFSIISFIFQYEVLSTTGGQNSQIFTILEQILPFFSKWMFLNITGLFFFSILSQNELIQTLYRIKIPIRPLLSIMIAFNTINRILESIEQVNTALNSREITTENNFSIKKFQYIFIVMILDNIEYISSLRATYNFDISEIEKKYGK